MIILIHGDDITNSRKKIDEYITFDRTIKLNCITDDISAISNSISFIELFSPKKTVVIENFLVLKSKDRAKIFDLINSHSESGEINIVLWENEKVDQQTIKKIKTKNIFLFEQPRTYYQFLDALYPGNKASAYKFYKKINKNVSDEMLYYSVVKRIRMLLVTKTGKTDMLEDTKKMQGWQLGKIFKQSSLWKDNELIGFYKKLFEIEFNMKTSNLPVSLSKHIDFLLLSL